MIGKIITIINYYYQWNYYYQINYDFSDGTLTLPNAIDFNAMYSRCNFDRKNGCILSQINKLTNEDEKKR